MPTRACSRSAAPVPPVGPALVAVLIVVAVAVLAVRPPTAAAWPTAAAAGPAALDPAAGSGAPALRRVADGPGTPPPGAPTPAGGRWVQPVERPVADPFRPPAGPYGPGNRGLEYATAGGEPVGSVGAGVVAFAGQVAGRLVVSVVHPGGLRSALTGLAVVSVRVGDVVRAGSPVGAAGPALHLGVRRGRTYLDPASLFGAAPRPLHAVLVPVGRPRWGAPGALR